MIEDTDDTNAKTKIGFHRARRKSSRAQIALIASPNGKTITQPDGQISTSTISTITTQVTPNGKTSISEIQTVNGGKYQPRNTSFRLGEGEDPISTLRFYSPVKSPEDLKKAQEEEWGNGTTSVYQGRNGNSDYMRPKVGLTYSEYLKAGVDQATLGLSVAQLPVTELESTELTKLDPSKPRIKRSKSTSDIMSESTGTAPHSLNLKIKKT